MLPATRPPDSQDPTTAHVGMAMMIGLIIDARTASGACVSLGDAPSRDALRAAASMGPTIRPCRITPTSIAQRISGCGEYALLTQRVAGG